MKPQDFAQVWFNSIPTEYFSVFNRDTPWGQIMVPPSEIGNWDMIRINPRDWQNALVVDVDEYFGALAWEDHGIAPNLSVTNLQNGHAHLVWRLKTPVWRATWGKPAQFGDDIQQRLTAASHGDPAYAASFMKNPLHARWRTTSFTERLYDLGDFSSLPYVNKSRQQIIQTGTGRNIDLFLTVKDFAYRHRDRLCGASLKDAMAFLMPEAKTYIEEIKSDYNKDEAFPEWEVIQTVMSVSRYAIRGKLFNRGHITTNPGVMNLSPGVDNLRLGALYTAKIKTEQTREMIRSFRLDHPEATQGVVAKAVGRSLRRVRDLWMETSPQEKLEQSSYIPVGLTASPETEPKTKA